MDERTLKNPLIQLFLSKLWKILISSYSKIITDPSQMMQCTIPFSQYKKLFSKYIHSTNITIHKNICYSTFCSHIISFLYSNDINTFILKLRKSLLTATIINNKAKLLRHKLFIVRPRRNPDQKDRIQTTRHITQIETERKYIEKP